MRHLGGFSQERNGNLIYMQRGSMQEIQTLRLVVKYIMGNSATAVKKVIQRMEGEG